MAFGPVATHPALKIAMHSLLELIAVEIETGNMFRTMTFKMPEE